MSITATTLSAAITSTDTYFGVAATTGITAPVSTTGSGYTYLLVEDEVMFVTAVNTTTKVVTVLRGQAGTAAVAHGASAPVAAGAPSDFPNFAPTINAEKTSPQLASGWAAPTSAASNVVTATGWRFHLTGTTVMKTLTAFSGYVEGGEIVIVFDGSGSGLTWDATGNIAVAGTATTAASSVSFRYDSGSAKWHPSRLA